MFEIYRKYLEDNHKLVNFEIHEDREENEKSVSCNAIYTIWSTLKGESSTQIDLIIAKQEVEVRISHQYNFKKKIPRDKDPNDFAGIISSNLEKDEECSFSIESDTQDDSILFCLQTWMIDPIRIPIPKNIDDELIEILDNKVDETNVKMYNNEYDHIKSVFDNAVKLAKKLCKKKNVVQIN